MSALRSFCLWVLMLVLPLQGFAAASMRFCGTSQSTPVAAMAVMATMAGAQQSGGHDHSAHAAHTGHASHQPAAQHDPAASSAISFAQEAPAHAVTGMSAHGALNYDTFNHDTFNHKCALCAGCCHAMALLPFFTPLEFGPLAHADPAEPLVLIQAMPVRVPEKPPRA